MNKQNAFLTLCDLKKVFDEHKINFWISDGTLLGYYRDKDFISHDPDIDVGIFIEDWDQNILYFLKNSGFNVFYEFGKEECGLEYAVQKRNIKIDLFFFYKYLPKRNAYWHAAWMQDDKVDNSLRKMIRICYEPFELQKITFLGVDFLAPDNIEKYIIQKYGKDWKTPKVNWNWTSDPFNSEYVDIFTRFKINPEIKYIENKTSLSLSKIKSVITKDDELKEKLMKNVTIIVKTFIRPECCVRLIESIRKKYPTITIIIADDGDISPDLSSFSNVEYLKMPFDSGVSAGRNLLMDNVKTKYYLSVDDDMVFIESTNLEIPYNILEKNVEIDMVGGDVNGIIYHGLLEKKDNIMNFYKTKEKKKINGYPIYDIILQFYLVKTEKIIKIKYDPELKTVDHMEFFWRAKDHLNITYTNEFKIVNKSDKNERYDKFRSRDIYLKLARQKMGIENVKYF